MSKFNTFEELKNKRKEWVKISRENGGFDGLKKLLTELYPDQAHFIYELLQNAEDKEATIVSFNLLNDKLVFSHNGKKRDFNLDDIDSITNIGTSTKIDDPTSIGKFGVGFKAVYSYTKTPEIHSGKYDFRIIDMLVPEDVGVSKTAVAGETKFIFPFDHDTKTPQQAVEEITKGLLSLDENSILFLKHIHQIYFKLPSGKQGGLKLEDKEDEVVKTIIKVNAITGEKTRTSWCKFSKQCVVKSEGKDKNCVVDIAYRLKRVETETERKLRIDPELKGNVCIFFPAVKEDSHLRFHINAPFASTVARDSVRDCSENKQLIQEIAKLCIESVYYLKQKHQVNLDLYATLPNRRDFRDISSTYYPIYTAILNEFKTKELIETARGEYKRVDEVLSTNRDIAKLIDDNAVQMLFNKSWIPPVRPQTNEEYFLLYDVGIKKFETKTIIDGLREIPTFYDKLFQGKKAEWFRDWYYLLDNVQGIVYSKEALLKVKMILCVDGELHLATDSLYLKNPNYTPEHLKDPLYVDFPIGAYSQNEGAKHFLKMLSIKEMSAEVDIMADISGRTIVAPDDVILTLMKVMEEYKKGKDISVFKDQPMLLGRSVLNGGLFRVKASECCIDEDVYFFYKEIVEVQYILCIEKYEAPFTADEMAVALEIFKKLGVKIGPEIIKCELTSSHPLYSQLNTAQTRERWGATVKDDYTITGADLLHCIPEEGLYKQSKMLWDYVVDDKNYYHHLAEYKANRSRESKHIDSTAAYYLKRVAWIPNKDGVFCRPCDITADDLYDGFIYSDSAVFLKNLGFGNPSKAPNDIATVLKNAGFAMSAEDEILFGLPEDIKKMIVEIAGKEIRRRKTKGLADAIVGENKDQVPYEEEDDYGQNIGVSNPTKRREKMQKEFEDSLTVSNVHAPVLRLSYPSISSAEEKVFVQAQYQGRCQICGRSAIRKHNGQMYFEAINIVNTAYLDRELLNDLATGWNTLCLCPNCAAEYRYCSKNLSDLESQVETTVVESNRNDYIELRIILKGAVTTIRFTPKHFLALQAAFTVFKNKQK